jgi:uncharacterized membrane protein YGL010W
MRRTVDLLAAYAADHRDLRNIQTHAVGVPMVALALALLLSRPAAAWGGLLLSPAAALWTASTVWYLSRSGHRGVALAVSALNGLLLVLAAPARTASTSAWLTLSLSCLLLGWALQRLGHFYEGRTPAWRGDGVGLLMAPMFVVAEGLFALGWYRGLRQEIERRVGPASLRDLAHPVGSR